MPTWSQQDRDYYRKGAKPLDVCMICGKTMEIGDKYFGYSGDMIAEPPRVFHDACRGNPRALSEGDGR